MTERVLLTGRVEDGPAAVEAAVRLARDGVQVVPWLVPGGPRDDDPLLQAARAAADREEVVPRGPAPDRQPEPDADVRVRRQALIVARRMLDLRDGQVLLAEGPDLALPLIDAITAEAAERGARVSARIGVDGLERALLEHSDPEALGAPDEIGRAAVASTDAHFRAQGEYRADALAGIDASRLAARVQAQDVVRKLRFARAADGSLRWALTAVPCAPYAARSGLDEAAFADLLYAAAGCDVEDPIALWERRAEVQEELRTRLEAGREVRIVGPGTDVVLGVGGRTWRSSAANRNLPDGEVFTGPVEDSAEGVVSLPLPTYRGGRRVAGVRLTLRAGEVVEATAEEGEDVLRAALALDDGARRLGELGIGTNFSLARGTGLILLDEKIGGTFHLAIGAGYPETGSTNRSAEHWDLIGDLREGGEIELDGEPLQRDGRFLHGLQQGL